MKRVAAWVALMLLVMTGSSGCLAGGSEKDDSEPTAKTGDVTVEFWTINLKKNYGDYFQGLIDAYEAEHSDVTIDWVDVPGTDIQSKFLASLAADDVPDAVNLVDIYIDQFADSLADLTPYVSDDELGAYIPGLVDSARRDDKLLGIPWYHGGAPVGWYNESVLEEAGLSEDDIPTTWSEALEFGRQIAEKTDACGFNELPSVDVLRTEGIAVLNEDGTEAALATPEAAAILDQWRDAYNDGAVCKGAVSEDIDSLPETVDNGLAASVVGGLYGLPFNLLNTETNAPDVYKELVVAKAVSGSTGQFVIPGVNTFVVPDQSDVKEQATDFIKFITNAENQLAFCELVTIFPSTSATLQDPFFTDIEGDDPQTEARATVVEELPMVVTKDLETEKDAELDEAYLQHIRAFMGSDDDALGVLEAVAEEWNTILAG